MNAWDEAAARAFLGRRSRRPAGGHSMGNTVPESQVPRASGAGGAGSATSSLGPAGAVAGEGRA